MQSLGHISGNSGTGSHHVKGGRNQKLNAKSTATNHMLKGTTAQSVSSSSSIGSSKISLNSGQHKSDSSQVYLKTLSRVQNMNQIGLGTKSTLVVRKTPSGSNSSSKTKKLKVTSSSGTATKTKFKASSGVTSSKHGGSVAQNPYPAGASHGHTIFSVNMPRQSLQ